MFSLHRKDYGFDDIQDFKSYVKNALIQFDIPESYATSITLMTIPSILGYSFNPITFWFCYDTEKSMRVVLVEVHNTFQERHGYVCFLQDFMPITSLTKVIRPKLLHVSPFCQVKGEYSFTFDVTDKKIKVSIDYREEGKKTISTYIETTDIMPLTDRNILRCFFLNPFVTFKVILLIHYQAFRLWCKKIKYFVKPPKGDKDLS